MFEFDYQNSLHKTILEKFYIDKLPQSYFPLNWLIAISIRTDYQLYLLSIRTIHIYSIQIIDCPLRAISSLIFISISSRVESIVQIILTYI